MSTQPTPYVIGADGTYGKRYVMLTDDIDSATIFDAIKADEYVDGFKALPKPTGEPIMPDEFFVIRDIENNMYVKEAMRSKQDAGVGGVEWVQDVGAALKLPRAAAHEVRAIAIMVAPGAGGREESLVRVEPAPAQDSEATLQLFTIWNPTVNGWYVKHVVDGDQMHVTWSSNFKHARYLTRAMAEVIAEREGLGSEALRDKEHKHAPNVTMQMRREYRIVRVISVDSLQEAIDGKLADGWELIGGMSATHADGVWHFHQALTRTVPVAVPVLVST